MALWTPYSDTALDLSKTAKEDQLPAEVTVPPTSFGYLYSPYPVHQTAVPEPYLYPYPPAAYSVPPAQMSPDSTGSLSSRYEGSYQRFSPHPTSALSPPDSPDLLDADSLSQDLEYQAFERDALQAMAEKNGGSLLLNNPRMRRAVQTSQEADDAYRSQRERNNFAAKQSRDRRKLREVRLALKVTFLKKQVSQLKAQLAAQPCRRCYNSCAC